MSPHINNSPSSKGPTAAPGGTPRSLRTIAYESARTYFFCIGYSFALRWVRKWIDVTISYLSRCDGWSGWYMHDNVIQFPTGGPVQPISYFAHLAPDVVN
jgi:hypothetical protein